VTNLISQLAAAAFALKPGMW